ncbi:Peptidyl-prolyl cis-trans isomerase ppiD [Imhoffiella purpurea]|uniref:Periplasmic chaperone PpiD n=1 Tax=Imhoffiella purpurea TaxID=1249627 RepID=W9W1Q1_9GAMM|nr:Peptidyl-prolyl cis-trans isomerase ppiD [Imhoffiella purpurea]
MNGAEITARDLDRRVQQTRFELRQRLGAAYDAAGFDDKTLRAEVLDDMIREVLLLDTTRRLGLRVSDQEVQMQILSERAFLRDGRFDQEAYERALQLQGLSPAMFEHQLRQQLAGMQLVRSVAASEFMSRSELADYQRLADQKREISYVRFAAADYADAVEPDDAAIQDYYEAHASDFQTPEQVKLDYIPLDSSTLASKVSVTEEELRQQYESEKGRFVVPERRQVRHILLTLPKDADEEAATSTLDEIEKIRERILAGESFEELAKTYSKDPGSAAKGGDLGMVEKGVMDPAFERAAFDLPVGEVSDPVRSAFGYHLIEVTSIEPEKARPFEEVRDTLRTDVAKQKADSLYYDLGERLANIVYESPDSLEPAAEELGLTIEHSDWVGRDGGSGILASPKVVAAAFSDEVLKDGINSDMLEPDRDQLQAIVLRVVDHREPSTKPLEEVREEILAKLEENGAQAAAKKAAEELADKLREGGDWETLAQSAEAPVLVDRNDSKMPAGLLDTAFTLPAPAEGTSSIGTTVLDAGDAAVVRVTEVRDGEVKPAEDGESTPEAAMLSQLLGRQLYSAMIDDIERRADIERKESATEETP